MHYLRVRFISNHYYVEYVDTRSDVVFFTKIISEENYPSFLAGYPRTKIVMC